MSQNNHLDPTIIVIFGAGGDLTWRKLVPALYQVFEKLVIFTVIMAPIYAMIPHISC